MRALILVDLQNDFMPDGSLPVREAYDIIPIANDLQEQFPLVVATQDWHPPDHGSLASNHDAHTVGEVVELHGLQQILWPDHCVQQTAGAAFVETLDLSGVDEVFKKGTDPRFDSYSGFFDNGHRVATGLHTFLEQREVEEVFIAGVATDYCVKYTVLDACRLGFDTHVVIDGCRGVELQAGDVDQAVDEMRDAGATIITSDEVGAVNG
jgi:nicotinamidase/pyrazinamidase